MIPEELIEREANKIWKKRQEEGTEGTSDGDWAEATSNLKNNRLYVWRWKLTRGFKQTKTSRFNQGLKSVLKPPIIFLWKTLPSSEWVKLLAVPAILTIAAAMVTNRFQEEQRQNETVDKYFDQAEKLILDEDLNLSEKDSSARTIIKARSLATLRSVDIKRKEIVINFLSESNLLNQEKDGVSLRYFDLPGVNLSGLDLRGIDLDFANLQDANLIGANIQKANLIGANIQKANLQKANLIFTDLSGADLEEANLIYADLEKANLIYADLHESDLSGADLEEANLFYADLHEANLYEADLDYADLSGANLESASLIYANLYEANLYNADLSGANLIFADLEEANLYKANLQSANLYEANLVRANLTDVLTVEQIKSTCNWDKGIFKGEWRWDVQNQTWTPKDAQAEKDNADYIAKLKNDTTSNPIEESDCKLWTK